MNRIKSILDKKGLTQTWLSAELGKSYNMVNAYAQNRRQPSLEVLYEIADILNVDVKQLLNSNKKK
jgi:putative transcriptional regulator